MTFDGSTRNRITRAYTFSPIRPIHPASTPVARDWTALVARGRRLEYFTIAWSGFEAAVALVSGLLAGSIALVAAAYGVGLVVGRPGRRTGHDAHHRARGRAGIARPRLRRWRLRTLAFVASHLHLAG